MVLDGPNVDPKTPKPQNPKTPSSEYNLRFYANLNSIGSFALIMILGNRKLRQLKLKYLASLHCQTQ